MVAMRFMMSVYFVIAGASIYIVIILTDIIRNPDQQNLHASSVDEYRKLLTVPDDEYLDDSIETEN